MLSRSRVRLLEYETHFFFLRLCAICYVLDGLYSPSWEIPYLMKLPSISMCGITQSNLNICGFMKNATEKPRVRRQEFTQFVHLLETTAASRKFSRRDGLSGTHTTFVIRSRSMKTLAAFTRQYNTRLDSSVRDRVFSAPLRDSNRY